MPLVGYPQALGVLTFMEEIVLYTLYPTYMALLWFNWLKTLVEGCCRIPQSCSPQAFWLQNLTLCLLPFSYLDLMLLPNNYLCRLLKSFLFRLSSSCTSLVIYGLLFGKHFICVVRMVLSIYVVSHTLSNCNYVIVRIALILRVADTLHPNM